MRQTWLNSILTRLVLLVLVATLIPAGLLAGVSLYVNRQVQDQMERQSGETLNLAINLEQTLLDASLTRMRDRAASLAVNPQLIQGLATGAGLPDVLAYAQQALPQADLITVVDRSGVVRGRAGSSVTGDFVSYGGLVQQVLESGAPAAFPERLDRLDLAGEPRSVLAQVRVPVLVTPAATHPQAGQVLEEALALVGAAPVTDEQGRLLGAILVSDILNNDPRIVDEVTNRAPQGLRINATVALDAIRVTTTVPAPGGGRRAVGTLYSDVVMENLRAGHEYRGRALVGGWQWERTIYLPMSDHAGRVVAGYYVGIPEAHFTALATNATTSTRAALAVTFLALIGAVLIAARLVRQGIVRPLERFTALLTDGDLRTRMITDDSTEMARLADALNGMTERIRQTVTEIARVSEGVRAVSDRLAGEARQTAGNAEGALQVAASALEAAEAVSASAQRAAQRGRDLELSLTRIEAGTEEQARTIQHAGAVVGQVTGAVQQSRRVLNEVMTATRDAVTAAQQGRHSALATLAALELARLSAEAPEPPPQDPDGAAAPSRLLEDLDRGHSTAAECDTALREITRAADKAKDQLWDLAAVLNESGARVGAVSRQMTDVAAVAAETAANSRSMGVASLEVIGEIGGMAAGTESAVTLVRQAQGHVTSIAESNRTLLELADRVRCLARELDEATGRFPRR